MDDEPLSHWAKRRDATTGQLRAGLLVTGDGPQGSHLSPGTPRVIERWNGHAWEVHMIASNLAEARFILYPEAKESAPAGPVPKALGPGAGRHRKPQEQRPEPR